MGSVELSFLQICNPDFCLVRMPRASISIFLSTFDIGRARRGLIEASSATKIIAGRACSDLMNVEMAWLAMIAEKGHAGFYHIGYIIECTYSFKISLSLGKINITKLLLLSSTKNSHRSVKKKNKKIEET